MINTGLAIALREENNLVVIDADKPEEVLALEQWWLDVTGLPCPQPTVKSPGVLKQDTWAHSGGGHWYITMPKKWYEGRNIKGTAQVKHGESKFDIKCRSVYILCPPTVRHEGEYVVTGEIIKATEYEGLVEAITSSVERVYKRRPHNFKDNRTKTPSINTEYLTAEDMEVVQFLGFNPLLSYEDKVKEWNNTVFIHDIIEKIGLIAECEANCGPNCIQCVYDGASQGRSAVIHSEGCQVTGAGIDQGYQITVFSDNLAMDSNQHVMGGKTTSLFVYIREKICGGSTTEVLDFLEINSNWNSVKARGFSDEQMEMYKEMLIRHGRFEDRRRGWQSPQEYWACKRRLSE